MERDAIYEKAIIASESDARASIERKALKNAGISQVVLFTSGIDLAYHLADLHENEKNDNLIVFCQPVFSDMSAVEFMETIRLHPLLFRQAFVGIASDKEESKAFISIGYTRSLTRPIERTSIIRALAFCKEFEKQRTIKVKEIIEKRGFAPNTESFYAKLAELAKKKAQTEITPQSMLQEGIDHIKAKRLDKAIASLSKASVDPMTAAESYSLISSIYAHQRNAELSEKYLRESIKADAMQSNHERMIDNAYKYKQKFPNAEHPLLKDFRKYLMVNKTPELLQKLTYLENLYPFEGVIYSLVQTIKKISHEEKVKKEVEEFLSAKNSNLYRLFKQAFETNKPQLVKEKKGILSKIRSKNSSTVANQAEAQAEVQKLEQNLSESTLNIIDNSFTAKNTKDNKKITVVPMIDEVSTLDYSKNEGSGSKNLLVNVIISTYRLYKKTKTEKK